MSTPSRRLTVPEFAHLLGATELTRRITAVHLHHTRPRRRDFRGAATIEAMRRYHIETNQWADIAQHLTIDPEGCAWTGRNWNMPPASSSGFNGTAAEGPFMIEMVGDFDTGQDPFDGPQREAAIQIVARLLQHFGLEIDAIKFHRDLKSAKTCPGTGIEYGAFQAAVKEAIANLPAPAARRAEAPRAPFAPEYRSRHAAPVAHDEQPADAVVPEHPAAAREIDRVAGATARARQAFASGRGVSMLNRDAQCGSPEWNVLKPHVVNLSRGVLSEGGEFCTTPDDLAAILDAVRSYAVATDHPHLVLYAHGGLVDEKSALGYAKAVLPWWKAHGVFPVFFVWESGLLEILRQFIVGPRDLADFTTDPLIEAATRIPGTIAWNGMKESARLSSGTDAGGGYAGGALQFARGLAAVVADQPIAVHAVGHSAGAIFHSHFLPALHALGVGIDSLALLAPASRVDLFKEKLLPLHGHAVQRLSFFTMEEDAERQDDCFGVYRKSLLYLVSRAFEGAALRKPIVGLEQCISKDATLAALFGLQGNAARAELQLSYAPGRDPNPLTQALRHGDFDNDPKTMSAVLRRVLQVADDTQLGEADFPFQLEPRTLDSVLPLPGALTVGAAASPGPESFPSPTAVAGRPRGRALCIGVDKYVGRPLAGCAKDARTWGVALNQLGFDITYLLDGQATREAIVKAIARLVAAGDPHAPLVLQYSGHGTQMPDDNGDEVDGFDEALVPVDYQLGRLLLDDDMADLLRKLKPGASITLFMDCCHSGTNSRFAPLVGARSTQADRVRFLPPSAELVEAHRAFRAGLAASTAKAAEESLPGVVHFAACQDNEFAWESAGQGDFTGSAAALLVDAVLGGQSNEEFMQAVQRAVGRRGRQHPLLMRLPAGLTGQRLLAARIAAV